MKVSVSRSIHCAHQLPDTEIHGHTYRITVICSVGDLRDGMTFRLERLKGMLRDVTDRISHQRLEKSIGEPATAERLALYVKDRMPLNGAQVRVEIDGEGWVETE